MYHLPSTYACVWVPGHFRMTVTRETAVTSPTLLVAVAVYRPRSANLMCFTTSAPLFLTEKRPRRSFRVDPSGRVHETTGSGAPCTTRARMTSRLPSMIVTF